MNDELEFAIREVAVAIDNLLEVVGKNSSEYDNISTSLHRALVSLMKEIEVFDWRSL